MTARRLALAVATVVALVPLTSGCSRVLGDGVVEGYHLTAEFERAVGLYPFGDVSSMGVGIGTVEAVEIDDDHVRVEMTINPGIPLPADVQATIEPLTLIGERNIVLFPPWDAQMEKAGKPKARDGDVIPLERTIPPIEPDEALETFNELARSLDPETVSQLVRSGDEAIRGLGDELGQALDQAAGITTTLAEVDTQLVDAADSLHVLAGSLLEREAQLGSLVRSFSDATQVLADEREGIRSFLSSLVDLTEQGRGILATYGEQLPQDIAHFTALAMLLDANSDAAQQLVSAFPEVAEGIARGYQPDIGGIYLRANGTPTLVGLLEVFRDLLGVLPPGAGAVKRALATAVVALLLAACSIQTATAPTGSLTLYATFEDAQDLTPGHNVQISNVVAGSVRDVSLDGYKAKVRMSISDGNRIPQGTRAVIRRTSLLGEYFVDLVLPKDFDPEEGAYLRSGSTISDTETQPDIEQLAQQASVVVGALTADDLATTVQAGAEALGGRGATLHRAIQDAGAVLGALADQQADIGAAIDGLAQLGASLGPAHERVGLVVEELAAASAEVAGSRAGAVDAVQALVDLATVTNDVVLGPHAERLRTLLSQISPILGALADRTDVLADLVTNLLRFTEAFPTALHDGQVLLLTWAYLPTAVDGTLDAPDSRDPLELVAQMAGGAR